MIALCGAACSVGAMTFWEAWRTPLAVLYQIQHFAFTFHGATCRWADKRQMIQTPVEEQQQKAAEQWQRIVDTLPVEER